MLVREEHTLEVDGPAPGVRVVRRVATDTIHLEAGPEEQAKMLAAAAEYVSVRRTASSSSAGGSAACLASSGSVPSALKK